jgi:3'(2'), 5'-bisphosphate nucleotidase
LNLETQSINEFIQALIPVSIEAGKAILDVYNSEDQGIQHKADTSPLTKADLASNKIICNALKTLTPDIPIISEENVEIPYSERLKWDYCWIVDPLDGTKEFIKRNGEFTTNIALVYKHRVIAGVVYLPVTDEMYYAVKGEGAFKISNQKTVQISTEAYTIEDKGLIVVCSRSHLDENTQLFIDSLSEPILISRGSSLKFMTIAQGEAHIYPRMAPTMEWDTCAAQIILEEAGGNVFIVGSDDETVMYNKENLLNPYFIAKGKEVS